MAELQQDVGKCGAVQLARAELSLVFPDASGLFRGGFLTHVPEEDRFSCVICHITGAENHWIGLLSRLRSVYGRAAGSGKEVPACFRSIAVVASAEGDYSFPSMGEIRDRQNIYTEGKAGLTSPRGSVVRGENELYCVDYGGMQSYG